MEVAINTCFKLKKKFKSFILPYSWTKFLLGKLLNPLNVKEKHPQKTMSISMHSIRQHQGETLMNWVDRAYQSCVRDKHLAPEAELKRFANWISTEKLLDGEITKELRRQTYVGLAVTVGKALDFKLNIPATNDDNDDDRWSITATVGVRLTREMATQTEMEEVPSNSEFHFHLLDLLLYGQQNMRWAIKHLIRVASNQGSGCDNR